MRRTPHKTLKRCGSLDLSLYLADRESTCDHSERASSIDQHTVKAINRRPPPTDMSRTDGRSASRTVLLSRGDGGTLLQRSAATHPASGGVILQVVGLGGDRCSWGDEGRSDSECLKPRSDFDYDRLDRRAGARGFACSAAAMTQTASVYTPFDHTTVDRCASHLQ